MSVRYPLAIVDAAAITAQVKTTLQYYRSISDLHTQVETNHGMVRLEGKARNAAEKNLLTQLVSAMYDVKIVKNKMTIAEARVDRLLNPSRPVHGCTGQAVS